MPSLTNQRRSITSPHSALGTFLGDETSLANRTCEIRAWWLVAQRIIKVGYIKNATKA